MRTFFKDEKTIIINSMDYTEALVGKAFINTLNTNEQTIKVEQRNDINDDFDGFVMTIADKPAPAPLEARSITIDLIENSKTDFTMEFYVSENEEYYEPGEVYLITDYDKRKLPLFLNFLTDLGVLDINFDYAGYITGISEGSIVEGSYTIPEGMFTFHKASSDEYFVNMETVITFVEVDLTPEPEPDTEAPVITLIGDPIVNIIVGGVYGDLGATAFDLVDGDITSKITADSNVDTSVVGTYEVRYNVVDNAGNSAVQVVRTVNVVEPTPEPDVEAPIITLVGDASVDVIKDEIYTDAGATATDNVDGDITSNIVVVNNVDTSVVGNYTITYNVVDSSGNAAIEVTRTVNVTE